MWRRGIEPEESLQLPSPDLSRRAPILLAKRPGELRLVGKTPAKRQFADGEVAMRVAQLPVYGFQALPSYPWVNQA